MAQKTSTLLSMLVLFVFAHLIKSHRPEAEPLLHPEPGIEVQEPLVYPTPERMIDRLAEIIVDPVPEIMVDTEQLPEPKSRPEFPVSERKTKGPKTKDVVQAIGKVGSPCKVEKTCHPVKRGARMKKMCFDVKVCTSTG